MIKQLARKPLWVNILVGLLIIFALVSIFFLSLDMITRHGDSKTVPAVAGKHINSVVDLLDKEDFEMIIQDSIYDPTLEPGIVIKQFPEPDAVVKKNRNIYVTINRLVPPDIDMPNVVGYTFRNALMVLENNGLVLGDTSYRVDFAKNSVLEQSVKAGTQIKVGTKIDLVLGSGIGNELIAVPKLIGLTYNEAKILAETQGITILPIVIGISDTLNAYVIEQDPTPKTDDGLPIRIRPGQLLTVRLSKEPPKRDSIKINTPQPEDD
jgi:beta-lactam-binding protein with PASTA domain